MKRIFLVLSLSAALCSLSFSCGKPSGTEEQPQVVSPEDGPVETPGPEPVPEPQPDPEPEFIPIFELGTAKISADASGGTYEVHLKTNIDYSVTVSEDAREWISAGPSGTPKEYADTFFVATISPKETVAKRTGKIYVDTSLGRDSVTVTQSGVDPVLKASVSTVWAEASGASFSVDITSNMEYSVIAASWMQVTVSDSGLQVSVSANDEKKMRSGVITVFNNETGRSIAVNVNQKSEGSIYILAVGNSFSWDAMEYLYPILGELGYTDIYLGNLYIGGCTLQTHAGHITSGAGAYQFRTNSSGSWGSTNNYSSVTALRSRPWDYVSVQQASGYSGIAESYDPYLDTIMEAVKRHCPGARRMWHMTWAYQGYSTHSDFVKYGNDQMAMYGAIVDAVKTKVLTRDDFDFVIPCGTAVQNLRTSLTGDNITRDGYHMSYDYGRLVTALMWARQISGRSIAEVSYLPSGYTFGEKPVAAVKEAVENAWKNPYGVTESSYPPVYSTVEPSADLWSALEAAGYRREDYEGVTLRITHNAFYNSTTGAMLASADLGSTASNLNQFAATQIFDRSQLPEGSVLVLKQGYQYRHEGWTSLTTKNSSSTRPGEVTASSADLVLKVDSAWWGSWNFRAFNLAKSGKPGLDAAGQAELEGCFAVFVPSSNLLHERRRGALQSPRR